MPDKLNKWNHHMKSAAPMVEIEVQTSDQPGYAPDVYE